MRKIEKGHIEFSNKLKPYKVLHLPASASLDRNGNELSSSPSRWIIEPYGSGSYTITNDNVTDILTHLSIINIKKSELIDAESELTATLREIAESNRYIESKKARNLELDKESLIDNLRVAKKDRDKLDVINNFLVEK